MSKYRDSVPPCGRHGDTDLISKIESLKPESIFEVLPKETFRHDLDNAYAAVAYLESNNCYGWYYAISKHYQPKSLMEIGVRYGYSLLSFLKGSEEITFYEGWDIQSMHPFSNKIAQALVQEQDFNCKGNIFNKDSFKETTLSQHFDMCMVDGCHEEDEKWHDLELALEKSKVLIMDDCDENWAPLLKRFIKEKQDKIERWCFIDTWSGTGVVEFK